LIVDLQFVEVGSKAKALTVTKNTPTSQFLKLHVGWFGRKTRLGRAEEKGHAKHFTTTNDPVQMCHKTGVYHAT
jgi:hypothetical protein